MAVIFWCLSYLSPNTVTSSIEIWHTWKVMNLRSAPLVEFSGVDRAQRSGVEFSINAYELTASIKTHTFQKVLIFPFKRTRFSITTFQHQTHTN